MASEKVRLVRYKRKLQSHLLVGTPMRLTCVR